MQKTAVIKTKSILDYHNMHFLSYKKFMNGKREVKIKLARKGDETCSTMSILKWFRHVDKISTNVHEQFNFLYKSAQLTNCQVSDEENKRVV